MQLIANTIALAFRGIPGATAHFWGYDDQVVCRKEDGVTRCRSPLASQRGLTRCDGRLIDLGDQRSRSVPVMKPAWYTFCGNYAFRSVVAIALRRTETVRVVVPITHCDVCSPVWGGWVKDPEAFATRVRNLEAQRAIITREIVVQESPLGRVQRHRLHTGADPDHVVMATVIRWLGAVLRTARRSVAT